MKDKVLKASPDDRNNFRDSNQLNYCIVKVTNENIVKMNRVSLFFSGRRINTNLSILIGSEIYLILGGGVRVIRDRENVNTNWHEIDLNKLLHEINKRESPTFYPTIDQLREFKTKIEEVAE